MIGSKQKRAVVISLGGFIGGHFASELVYLVFMLGCRYLTFLIAPDLVGELAKGDRMVLFHQTHLILTVL